MGFVKERLINILKSLETESSLEFFRTISRNRLIKENSEIIHETLCEYFIQKKINEKDWDFLISLTYHDFLNDKRSGKINQFLNALATADSPSGNLLYELLAILEYFNDIDILTDINDYSFLNGFINDDLDEDSLKLLLNFIDRFNIKDEDIIYNANYQLKAMVENFAKNDLYIDFQNHIQQYFSPDGEIETEIDISAIESEVTTSLESYLSDFNQSPLESVEFDIYEIVTNLDIDSKASDFIESYEPYDGHGTGSSYNTSDPYNDNIDYF